MERAYKCYGFITALMVDSFEWPDETAYDDDDETAPVVDDSLPADHRSGFVAVVGQPNVGKSTLLNRLLGQKIAIVSHKPQTTRNQLLGILTLPATAGVEPPPDSPPAQIVFVDTPGIHQPQHKLGHYLVETALAAIADADLILWLVDASQPPTEADRLVAEALHQVRAAAGQRHEPPVPVLLALNKIDLLPPESLAGVEQPFLKLYPADEWLLISAGRGDHLDELLGRMIAQLPLGPRYFPEDQITDQQTRFIAAELIREAALNILHQEVPHALAVRVNEFKPRHEHMTYISADLLVERDSQKGIVIGEKGKMLKKIGQLARPQIEELVGSQVFLELWVKVHPKWRQQEEALRRLGYSLKR